jgi:hypothetical protein
VIHRLSLIQMPQMPHWQRQTTYRCEVDDWEFDARYTDGACPICGWKPAGAPAAPLWLALVRRVDWELVGLLALFAFLVFWGVIVIKAAHLF